ncbi:MAG TPA: ribosome biogenesis GTPase Der [bacterium]|nr:ribosome biogenesis GTPase Der [bacterium]
MLELVAIIGKPNVGKSTLFNRIIKQRRAVTSPIAGVTRDRIIAQAECNDIKFNLVDTGGIITEFKNDIEKETLEQTQQAIDNANVIILLLDAQSGITALDEHIVEKIRKINKPIIVAINKVDDFEKHDWSEFYKLGFDELIPISAEHGKNINELLDKVVINLRGQSKIDFEFDGIKIAIIGRPNVGKSSILNKISGTKRSIVSDIPGTTRDIVETIIKYHKKNYLFLDTAGLRKKQKINDAVEHYSVLRTLKGISDCDISLLVIDALRGIDEQDLKIAELVIENNKGLIIAVNKWDLIEKENNTAKQFEDYIYKKAPFIRFAPIIFISALTGQRLNKIYETADLVFENLTKKISTAALLKFMNELKSKYSMPANKGKKIKLNYFTQVEGAAPTFVAHITHRELATANFKNFLINQLRENFGFIGAPLNLYFKNK